MAHPSDWPESHSCSVARLSERSSSALPKKKQFIERNRAITSVGPLGSQENGIWFLKATLDDKLAPY